MSNELLIWRRSSTPSEWSELASKAGTSTGYLNLIAYGHRNASPKLALAIENASKFFSEKPEISKERLVFKEFCHDNFSAGCDISHLQED